MRVDESWSVSGVVREASRLGPLVVLLAFMLSVRVLGQIDPKNARIQLGAAIALYVMRRDAESRRWVDRALGSTQR